MATCPSCLSGQIPLPRQSLTELTAQLCTSFCQLQMSPSHSHGPRSICLQISSAFAKSSGKSPRDQLKRWLQSSVSPWQRSPSQQLECPHTIHMEQAHGLQSNAAQAPQSSPGPLGCSDSHLCTLNAWWQQPQAWPHGRASIHHTPHRNRKSRTWAAERLNLC